MSFNRPTLQTLIDRAITDIESRLPGTDALVRRSALNVLGKVHAGGLHGVYGYLDYLSEQFLASTAEDDWLDRHAAEWDLERKDADAAQGNVDFTGTDGTIVPAGTALQRADAEEYTTDADVTISAGAATAAVTATIDGQNGNAAASTELSLVTPVTGIDSPAAVDSGGLTGGADIESNEALHARLQERKNNPPHGGDKNDYVAWALEVAGVTRAWCYPLENGDGSVVVRFMMDDTYADGIPLSGDVTTMQDYIDGERPVSYSDFQALAPVAATLDFTIELTPNTTAVQQEVEAELEDLLRREAEPGATILLSHINEAISLAEGETDHILTNPTADVTHTAGQIAVMGTITWV